jgi:trimeric autotransporter adhesin
MNTKNRKQQVSDGIVQSLRAFTGSLTRLLPALNLVAAPIARGQTSNLPDPRTSPRRKRTTRFAKSSLLALACALAGVASARADGQVTVTAATGGAAIPATTANGAWTKLTGPVLTESASGSIAGNGTVVLTVPNGFEFNPNASVTVLVEGCIGPQAINGVSNGGTIPVTATSTTLTFEVTSRSGASPAAGITLTFQNIQVRPTAGSPLASGNLLESGTCGLKNLTLPSGTWGFLREVGGAATAYQITGTNYTTAGAPVSITIQKVDQFGNPSNDSTAETLLFSGCGTAGANAPTVNDSPDAFTTGITVIFDANGSATVTLIDYLAETATLNVTDGTTSSSTGLSITVVPGPASALSFDAAPGSVTYGSTFEVAVHTTDEYGNPSTTGLGSSVDVTLTLTSGPGSLSGTVTQDIGTSAGNGTADFTGLGITAAGTGQVLTASADGLTSGAYTINVAQLMIAPAVVVGNKIYDGTTGAPIIGRSLAGVLGSDDVSLGLSGVAAFADKHAGTGKPVTVTGLSLTGSAAANYQLATTSTSAAADITARPVAIAATSQHRTYDGTTVSDAMPTISSGSLATGDTCALNQHFGDKHVGKGKLLIPSGSINDGNGGNNYSVTFLATTNGVIDPTPITVTAAPDNKPYDGTTGSTGVPVVAGAIASGDTPSFTQAFDNRNAGAGKTLIPAGSIDDGAGGSSYAVSFVSSTAGTITAQPITVTAVPDHKEYDGTTASAAVPTLTAGSLISPDTAVWTEAFSDKTAGAGKTLIPGGVVADGNGGNNYVVTFVNNTGGVISAKALTVTGITASDKAYDGTLTATLNTAGAALNGLAALDVVNLDTTGATGAFTDPNVGSGKTVLVSGLTIEGADAGNYTLTQPATTANITQAGLTVTGIEGLNKVYDGTNSATLIVNNAVLVGVLTGDTVMLDTTNAVGAFADKNVGTGKLVTVSGLALLGADAAKYTLTQPATNADITSATLTVTGITASDKVYDGTASATLDTTSAALASVINGDDVTLDTTAAAGAFDDPNAGTGKTVQVSGLAISGADLGNYTLTQPTTTASITVADAVVTTWPTASAITYGQTLADSTLSAVSATTGSFAFATPSTAPGAGTAPQSVIYTPADTANYHPATGSVSVTVNPAALTVSAASFSRTYGADNPSITGTLTGVLAGDNMTVTCSTDAQASSPAGTYSIVPALSDPNNRLANYSVTVNNGTLTITPASSTVALSSSQYPSVEGSSVGLTATLSPVAPAATTPTGSVQFYANGQPLAGPVALTDGAATLNTTQLSAGSNTITSVYLGDANFLASSNSLIQAVQMDIQTVTILSIVANGDGTATVTCQGVPDTQYLVQATPALNVPITWETVSTNTSGYIDGQWTYVDDMTQHPQRFFRAAKP